MMNIYEKILNGFVLVSEVKRKLNVKTTIDEHEIIVYPRQIINMLEKCLEKKMTTQQLSQWSSFLLIEDIYISPNWNDDEKVDEYEAMWYVLQQLSSRYVDGKITDERIMEHIAVLQKM